MMIRAIPEPMGSAAVRVPRQAMLTELGIAAPEDVAAFETSAAADGRYEPLQRDKVGRNEPCPCGSGEKYKKCCGR